MTWADLWAKVLNEWIGYILAAMTGAFTLAYRRLSNRLKKHRTREDALEAGVEALLADRLIQLRNYYADRGYCPTYARTSADAMYKAYHDLGGNGMITDVFDGLKKLPMDKKKEESI